MKSEASDQLQVEVWRGDADGGFESFTVPLQANQTVLDVVSWIQRYADATLSYRFACRVGMCGSCAMMVNGVPRWTCRSHVGDVVRESKLRLEPLRNLPIIKDLVCDMGVFFAKWQRAEGRFHGRDSRRQAVAAVAPNTPAREVADSAIECINCAICYAACDVVAWNPDYLGPAALNRALTLQNDERDIAFDRRLAAVGSDAGCHQCHSQQGCSRYCPNGLDPSASIAALKRMVSANYLRRKSDA